MLGLQQCGLISGGSRLISDVVLHWTSFGAETSDNDSFRVEETSPIESTVTLAETIVCLTVSLESDRQHNSPKLLIAIPAIGGLVFFASALS